MAFKFFTHVKEENGKSTLCNLNFTGRRNGIWLVMMFLFFTDVLSNIKSSNAVQWQNHLKNSKNDTMSSGGWIKTLQYLPYCVTNAIQLFTIMGTSFLLSCWSCNALPSVPAAFSIAVCQTVKSNLVCPWMYNVL